MTTIRLIVFAFRNINRCAEANVTELRADGWWVWGGCGGLRGLLLVVNLGNGAELNNRAEIFHV